MTGSAGAVVVETTLDDIRSADVRFLGRAAEHGPLHVRIPSDGLVAQLTGRSPAFPEAERVFLARSIRWVASVEIVQRPLIADLAAIRANGAIVVAGAQDGDAALRQAAAARGVPVQVIDGSSLSGFPVMHPELPPQGSGRVVVTGCYDWLHSGHVRFFMDAAAYGALYVVVGSDRNVALLKGAGHPLQGEEERRYMVAAMRPVHACLVSTGEGWMDAEPEIEWIQPTHYVVNEDGDQPEKREFCAAHGIEYVVLQRLPEAGLPARSSTVLRGF